MATAATGQQIRNKGPALIDCDVHTCMSGIDDIADFMPERWRRHHKTFRGNSYHGNSYPRGVPNGARADAWPPDGGFPGSSLSLMREQLLDAWNVQYVILQPLVRGVQSGQRNLDYAAQVSSAVNSWTASDWLDPEPRLRGSIVTSFEDPPAAVKEIERVSRDSRFVQVHLQIRTSQPLGSRKYWPIYEACEDHGLPIGVHFGGSGGIPITGAGWPSFYLEDHVGNAQSFQAQVTSLVFEGVFERFPRLKCVMIEGGVAWLPALAWRMDNAWHRLKGEIPHLRRLPSEYIADHVWLTTQPVEEPPQPRDFLRLMEAFPALSDRLMFSTDYPHWDFDNPDFVFRKIDLPQDVADKVRSGNARALYGL